MSQCKRAAGHDEGNCCSTCHAQWEARGQYMCDGFDAEGYDLHTCCRAAMASRDYLNEHRVQMQHRPPPDLR